MVFLTSLVLFQVLLEMGCDCGKKGTRSHRWSGAEKHLGDPFCLPLPPGSIYYHSHQNPARQRFVFTSASLALPTTSLISHLAVLFVKLQKHTKYGMGRGSEQKRGREKRHFFNFASNVFVNWTHQLKSFVEIFKKEREREKMKWSYAGKITHMWKSFRLGDSTIYSPKCPAVSLKCDDLMRCCKGVGY